MNNVTIFIHQLTSSPTVLEQWISLISPERMEQLSHFPQQRQQHSLWGDLLALAAFRRAFPGDPFPPKRAVTSEGKPFFPAQPTFHYSVSHSGNWVVCAAGDAPLGIDIQEKRAIKPVIFRALAQTEQAYLSALDEVERDAAFFDLWCLKEAYAKATGHGLQEDFRSFTVSRNPPHVSVAGYSAALLPFRDSRYHLGICIKRSAMPPITFQHIDFQAG